MLVVLNVYAGVRSAELKAWRSQQPARVGRGETVAASLLTNLSRDAGWLEWNVADPGKRAAAVADVIALVEGHALPWFDTFADADRLVDRLSHGGLTAMEPGVAIEILVWLGHPRAAERHARALLEEPAVAESCARELRRLGDRPPSGDEPHGDTGAQVARAIVAYGLHR